MGEAVGAGGGTGKNGHPDAAGHHVADGLQGTALEVGQWPPFVGGALAQAVGTHFQNLVAKAVTGPEQQHVFAGQVVDGHPLLIIERMRHRHQGHEGLFVERRGEHSMLLERQGDDDGVHLAVLELFSQHMGVVLFQDQGHLGRALGQFVDQVGKEIGADGVDGAHPQGRGELILALGDDLLDFASLFEDPLGLGHHLFAHRGDGHLPLTPFEKLYPQLALQLLHRHAQSRLADEAGLGGTSEMAGPGHRHDVFEFVQGHGFSIEERPATGSARAHR